MNPFGAMAVAALLNAPSIGLTQHQHHGGHSASPTAVRENATSHPYASMQQRRIKALPESTVADLANGRGASFALPAELNGYPGPAHVLELAEPLKLTPDQTGKTRELFAAMQAETTSLGLQLIAAEERLDRLFSGKTASASTVDTAALEAAGLQGKLRSAHLRYHLEMMSLLAPAQVAQYSKLRGYK